MEAAQKHITLPEINEQEVCIPCYDSMAEGAIGKYVGAGKASLSEIETLVVLT